MALSSQTYTHQFAHLGVNKNRKTWMAVTRLQRRSKKQRVCYNSSGKLENG